MSERQSSDELEILSSGGDKKRNFKNFRWKVIVDDWGKGHDANDFDNYLPGCQVYIFRKGSGRNDYVATYSSVTELDGDGNAVLDCDLNPKQYWKFYGYCYLHGKKMKTERGEAFSKMPSRKNYDSMNVD
jgi:hypothetical protein